MNRNILSHYTLLCPGPVNVSSRVADAYSRSALSHREINFTRLLREVQRDILSVAGVNKSDDYSALIITGSGTAANEAVLASAVAPDKSVIALSNGEFGERLTEISQIYNRTIIVRSEWGEELDLVRLEEHLATGDSGLVSMVHHETSTGLLNPVQEVGRLCKQYGVSLLVDGVSSFSADVISVEEEDVTFLTTSSGKAIGSYPGLSFVIGKNKNFTLIADYPVRNHYLNLNRYYNFSKQCGQTPNTPAISLFASLHAALQDILTEGLELRYQRLSGLAAYMRRQLADRNLYFQGVQPQSVVLTNVLLPEAMSFVELQNYLRQLGFVIYDAKGPLRGRYFQVSTIGNISVADIDRFLIAFNSCMSEKQLSQPTPLSINVS